MSSAPTVPALLRLAWPGGQEACFWHYDCPLGAPNPSRAFHSMYCCSIRSMKMQCIFQFPVNYSWLPSITSRARCSGSLPMCPYDTVVHLR
ncbi:hypothetical protein CALVIDRAFT_326741 [Calocera viscosa TUFC12733]|uniref:Uncharacterized protein n=1 Tax=Calocera viscosa (strain TUFC12733) TaxID=1330018 RepID=A0A167QUS8_CALVF|nr:hypothetical protein CALVIDRAFT_326741 [Calocera viscosa TUFC12733]